MPFSFQGNGGEYFKIWIVNIFLTILTLGIYSAWAKVRRNRYFYGNTQLSGTGFDYLAKPINILKGRLIAFAALVIYNVSVSVMPILGLPLSFAFLFALPWLIVKSMSFRTRNTAFRNIRFGFTGSYGGAAKTFILLPILGLFSLGLAYPYVINKQKEFIIASSRYGKTAFTYSGKTKDFFKVFLILFLIVIGMMAAMAGIAAVFSGQPPSPVVSISMGVVTMFFYFWIFAFSSARIGNLVYNSAHLGANGFRSELKVNDLFLLYLTNTLGIVFTLGLFVPWAQVRMARYRAAKLQFLAADDLSGFLAGEQEKVGSAGEEVGEMFDIDIGL